MMYLYILLAILMFGVLITVHELGHFLSAKLLGVRVNEFAVGMGPRLWGRQGSETAYSLRLLPIGGYCAMEGEDGDSDDPRAFGSASLWRRFVILAAGSVMNFLAGLVIVLLLVAPNRTAVLSVIEQVTPGGAAEGILLAGDRIVKVDGHRILTSADVGMFFARSADGRVTLEVERDGARLLLPVQLQKSTEGDWILGVNRRVVEAGLLLNLRESFLATINFVRIVFLGLTDLLSGRAGLGELSGPVGIVGAVGQLGAEADTVALGLYRVFSFMALIAVNLAVMNLLPIPALDGGRILFLLVGGLYTLVTRRKLNPKVEGYINAVGLVCLLALMAVVAVSDIWKLF